MVYSKTATYLLPLINKYININRDYLVNVYLGDELHNRFNDLKHLYIRFKFIPDDEGIQYEDYLINSPYIEGHYDVDKDTYMVVFKIPKVEQNLVDKYLEGKYSELPNDYKNDIISYYNLKQTDRVFQVLHKDHRLRKVLERQLNVSISPINELSSPPVIDNELFKDSVAYMQPT